MKRIIFALLLLPQFAYSQYRADAFNLNMSEDVSHINIGNTYTKDTILYLSEISTISGLSITGTSFLNNNNDSYIRVTLLDEYNYEFLVYENYPLLSDGLTTKFTNVALETVLLDDIVPHSLKISILNASLKLDTISFSKISADKRQHLNNHAVIQKAQTKYIVDKLNENLKRHNMTWRAGITSMSERTYSEKKEMFGGDVPQLYGFEHYIGGIFVMPGDYTNSIQRQASSNQYVSEWDWRNRHGKNWMTPVRSQRDCSSCWAHAAVGMVEAYINLYYNRILNYDLSEQEIISCTNYGCNPGYVNVALKYIRDHGIINESCFPYTASYENCNTKCTNPDEQIFINNYQSINLNNGEDSIKRKLFRNPLTICVRTWGHSMIIAGYKTIEIGDTIYLGNQTSNDSVIINNQDHQHLIGRTAWLVKNSYKTDWGNKGYCYLLIDIGNIIKIHTVTGEITSLNYTNNDIICSDADGDGYYFWGLGPKPSNCPSWVPDTPDGDDSNINYGSLDNYGNLATLSAGITIKTPVTYANNSSTSYRLGIVSGGSLTITGTTTLTGNAKIRVCEGGLLIIDGGTLQNADITLVPGCTVIVRNNGRINMATGKQFEAPLGAVVNIESGDIN